MCLIIVRRMHETHEKFPPNLATYARSPSGLRVFIIDPLRPKTPQHDAWGLFHFFREHFLGSRGLTRSVLRHIQTSPAGAVFYYRDC